jgi:hypothetical protein
MDTNGMSISVSAATMKKATAYHPLFGERAKRAIQTASTEIARAMQEAARVLRIIIFLHSAKNFPSILRLYRIESPSETE